MIPVITPDAMRAKEREAITRLPHLTLMERAARSMLPFVPGKKIFIACGTGGNGGDGLALARLLAEEGRAVRVFLSGEPKTREAASEYDLARSAALPIGRAADLPDEVPDSWVDCLLGTGLKSDPAGDIALLATRINADRARGACVVSCDIPTGLDAATGKMFRPCVIADRTVTFHALKTGLLLADGPEAAGQVHATDIGLEGADASLFTDADALSFFPPRARNSHKGNYGRLLIVAGERGMAGAAAMAALGAMRSGAGLTTVACIPSVLPIVQTLAPCATCCEVPEENGRMSPAAAPVIERLLASRDAVAAGPGMGSGIPEEVLRALLLSGKSCVFDAGALDLLKPSGELYPLLDARHLLTPHPGEAARLLGRPVTSPVADARFLARGGLSVLLKGRTTVVTNGQETRLVATGTPGMSRGGSGDVLTGVAGALLARGIDPLSAGCAASFIAGRAGELAAEKVGEWGMSPMDTIACLPEAIRSRDK